jgi:hypothetical protein
MMIVTVCGSVIGKQFIKETDIVLCFWMKMQSMSKFMLNLTAINPGGRQRGTPPVEVIAYTGSEVSWMPIKELLDIGALPECKNSLRWQTSK